MLTARALISWHLHRPLHQTNLIVINYLGRDHVNVVFIGHIDAGKSTLAGQILFLTVRWLTG